MIKIKNHGLWTYWYYRNKFKKPAYKQLKIKLKWHKLN